MPPDHLLPPESRPVAVGTEDGGVMLRQLWSRRTGHAESGITAPLVERIGRWVSATIGA